MRLRIMEHFRWALGLLPGLAVLGVLAGLAIAGHLSGWKLSNVPSLLKPVSDTSDSSGEKADADKGNAPGTNGLSFPTQEALEKSGIKTAPVTQRPLSQYVVANGTIDYSRDRLAHLSTRAPGHVWKVYKRVGEQVLKGDVLGLIDASEVGRAKADYLLAVRSLELKAETQEQLRQAAATSALPNRQLREGETAVAEARIRLFTAQQALVNLGLPVRGEQFAHLSDEQLARRLQFLGLPETIAATFDPATTTANLVPLVAPFDGVVIRSEVAVGEVVNSTQPQFIVADVRRLWVTLDVRQEDVGPVHKGKRVTFRPDGTPGVEAAGEVAWVSTEVNDKTRTVSVRAEVDNARGQLRARSYGTGKILIVEKPGAVTVPAEAVQWNGSSPLLFVQQESGFSFEPRKVQVGLRSGGFVEVLAGARPGEIVATTGSHVLRSELFKNQIGHEAN